MPKKVTTSDLSLSKNKKTGIPASIKIGAGAAVLGTALLVGKKIVDKNKSKQATNKTETTVQEQTVQEQVIEASPKDEKKSKTLLYVGIGVGVLAVVGMVLAFSSKK